MAKSIKVRAKQLGYFDLKRRYPGDEFFIKDEKAFSAKWMEKVEGRAAKPEPEPEVDEAEDSDEGEVI